MANFHLEIRQIDPIDLDFGLLVDWPGLPF